MKFLFSVVLLSALAYSQTFQGALRGRIVDPSGLAIGAVQVTLTDEGTSVSRTTVSNEQGEYVFSSVNPATYTINAELAGFKRVEQKGVLVSTQSAVRVDLTLELGQVNESVTVTSEVPLLQVADASTGQVLDRQKIVDLPILGRNPFLQARLAQAVVFAGNPKFARMQDQNGNSQVSIAGGPTRGNNYTVDGISITDANNRAVIVPSPEAVQELKLQASTYDAEVSRTGGGTFNTLLRSGTNDIHGSAVGHIRQTNWQANDFFANRAGRSRADQPFRDWGASLGGPVFIPRVYDGRNRSFWFLATEAYRQTDGNTNQYSVPTPLELQGNFSQSFGRTGALQTIYDPLTTTAAGARTAFAGNIIPASRMNPIGARIASYYPSPTGPTPFYGAPNYTFTGSSPNRGDQYLGKFDHQFSPWLTATLSYVRQKTFETSAGNTFGNDGSPNQGFCCDRKIDATQANATVTPNATTTIAIRWGFNRFYNRSTQRSLGFDLASLGLPASLVNATPNPAFPAITMGGLSNFGGGTTSQDVYYSRTFSVTASKFVGKHSFKGGFEFRTLHDVATPASGPTALTFNDVFTRPNPRAATTGQGSDLATLLLGYPAAGSMAVVTKFDNYLRYYGFFVHDDYRITRKLTLNLGFRFEYESGLRDVNNSIITGFDTNAASPLAQPNLPLKGVVQYAGVGGNPTQAGSPLAIKPSPRFGFAYSADGKTVIRGGYGIFWAPRFFNYQNAIGYSQNTPIVASTDGNFTPTATLNNPYPNGLLQPTGNSLGGRSGVGQAITIPDQNAGSAGYVQQYSLEIQRELPKGFVVTVGALGSRGLHLQRSGQNINQLNPVYFGLGSALTQSVANPLFGNGGEGSVGTATVQQNQLLRAYPQFTSVTLEQSDTGNSRYYSFYFRGERRYANGLSLLASYTWARNMDDVTGYNTAGTTQITGVTGPQNAFDLRREWSLATQDVPNRFTTAVTYELPFGRSKRFLRNNFVLDLIAGGWSINGVTVIQSGFPIPATQPNNNSVIGANHQRPNATGISPETSGSTTQRIDGWLNPAAFTPAAQFTFGSVSRFINVRGPNTRDLDLSIFKTFSIKERIRAQFRAEALNAFNHPIFGRPNSVVTDNQFGLITSQANYPRLLQLGLRVTF